VGRWWKSWGVVICAVLFAGLGCSRSSPAPGRPPPRRASGRSPSAWRMSKGGTSSDPSRLSDVDGPGRGHPWHGSSIHRCQNPGGHGGSCPSGAGRHQIGRARSSAGSGATVRQPPGRTGIAGPNSTVAGVQPGQRRASAGRSGGRADQSQAVRGSLREGAISASQRDSAQTQYDVAVASLRSSEAQYESDRAAVKNAEASVVQATAALDIARKRLQDTDVVSPITGFVRKRLVNVGETFKEKTPLMSLVATHALKLQGDVPERFCSPSRSRAYSARGGGGVSRSDLPRCDLRG